MLKKILKIVFSLVLVLGIIFTFIYINKDSNVESNGNQKGTITVIVNNINDEIVSVKRIDFDESDTLYDIISSNYSLTDENSIYGHYIYGIKDDNFDIMTDKFSSWIWFEMATIKEGFVYEEKINFENYDIIDVNYGIDSILLKDNMIFGINQRDDEHQTSIFNHEIDLSSGIIEDNVISNFENNFNKVFKNICYFLLAVIILFVIILFIYIKKSSKIKLTTKKLCILSLMCVILFVQEELLTFIPNFQLTFLLLAVYSSVFGLKNTSMIVVVHVLLDNIVMGSMTPIVFIPMLIGYLIFVFLIYLVKNRNLIIITIVSVIGSLIYCYLFMITNALFLNIDMYHYFIADIPFEILLVLSTILTISLLYRNIEKVVKKNWEES